MAAISNHWGDIRNWVLHVIETMTDDRQYKSASRLVELLYRRMQKEGVEWTICTAVYRDLYRALDDQWGDLITKRLDTEQ